MSATVGADGTTVPTPVAVQHPVMPFLQTAAAIALPFLLGLYVIVSVMLTEFYRVFGITLDQAGINQTVLLSRMANVIVLLAIALVPLACVAVCIAWLVDRLTQGHLSTVIRAAWSRAWWQALLAMLLVGWFLAGYFVIGFQLSHFLWIGVALLAGVLVEMIVGAAVRSIDQRTFIRIRSVKSGLNNGDWKPWVALTTLIGVAYNVIGWIAVLREGDSTVGFVPATIAVAGSAGVVLLCLVFFVFYLPFRLLLRTRYFRLITTAVAAVLAVLVLSGYAFDWVYSAARDLHDTGRFAPGLSRFFGVQPQIATVRWAADIQLIPEKRKVLVLGQSEEGVWLYDCVEQRTIRVSGGAIVATELVLDPYTSLTCATTEIRTDSDAADE